MRQVCVKLREFCEFPRMGFFGGKIVGKIVEKDPLCRVKSPDLLNSNQDSLSEGFLPLRAHKKRAVLKRTARERKREIRNARYQLHHGGFGEAYTWSQVSPVELICVLASSHQMERGSVQSFGSKGPEIARKGLA